MQTDDPIEAAEFIKHGGIVAFPTETVYGLGASVFNEQAIMKVFQAKRRPADNPLIAHISSMSQLGDLANDISDDAKKLIDAFFPGPLTLVLLRSEQVPAIATAGLDTVGVRMPANSLAREFIAAGGVPLVAPSANISGRPSPTTWQAVLEDMDGRIDCILRGEPTEIGIESTVVDCTGARPVLLRLGSVSLEQLRAVVPGTVLASDPSLARRSPGLRHKHYSPAAKVVIVTEPGDIADRVDASAYIGLHPAERTFALVRVCSDVEEYARSVFEFFRECDRRKIDTIYCESVPRTGIGAALMDRIRRAAERH